MTDKPDGQDLCDKIRTIYPDIGECGIDVDVEYSDDKEAWVVDLKQGGNQLKTHLEEEDANACMEGKQCVRLGTQIAQLVDNIKKKS